MNLVRQADPDEGASWALRAVDQRRGRDVRCSHGPYVTEDAQRLLDLFIAYLDPYTPPGLVVPNLGDGAFVARLTQQQGLKQRLDSCLLYTSPSPRDGLLSR